MKRNRKIVAALLVVVVAGAATWLLFGPGYPDLEYLQRHRHNLDLFVEQHYLKAVGLFMLLYLWTALVLPGALVLTVAGGVLFGALPTVIYVNIAATAGAVLAFLATRYLIGERVQNRFGGQLRRLNRELDRHGSHYLISLRILPVMPFFMVNYCAGLTRMPLGTYVWCTSLGMLPGSSVYAFAGARLSAVTRTADLVSPGTLLALLLLGLLSLFPVLINRLVERKRRKYKGTG